MRRRKKPHPTKGTLKPGSVKALRKGCTCPVNDNNYGDGMDIGIGLVWWVTSDCPLHGTPDPTQHHD